MELVRDRWYIVLDAAEVPKKGPHGALRHGVPLVFWRADGQVHCASDICPHRGAALHLGTVHDGCIVCPFHGFRFDGAGQCTHMPPQGTKPPPKGYGVQTWEAREAHGYIWLWWGERRETYPPIPWFPELDEPGWRWRWSRFHDDWPIHYTRVLENQLDFTHLPFVHATSIGRTVAHEVEVTVESDGDRMTATASNQRTLLELVAPNLWRNRMGAKTQIVAVFVPIDAENTRTYIRFYQRIVPWPVLGDLVCWLTQPVNRFILSQDRRVVTSQLPSEAVHGSAEKLVRSDAPILWARRWRARELNAQRGEDSV